MCCFSVQLGVLDRVLAGILSVQLIQVGGGQIDISAQLEGEVGVSFHYMWGKKGLDVLSLQLEVHGAGRPFCAADRVGEPGVIYVQLGVGADFLSVQSMRRRGLVRRDISVQLGVEGGAWVPFCTADEEEGPGEVICLYSAQLGIGGGAWVSFCTADGKEGLVLFLYSLGWGNVAGFHF